MRHIRLTTVFGKTCGDLIAAVSLGFMSYNFCRVHRSLRGRTPAMAAGIADRVWTLDELIGLLAEPDGAPSERATYGSRAPKPITR